MKEHIHMLTRTYLRPIFLMMVILLLLITVSESRGGSYTNSAHGNSTNGVDRSFIDLTFTKYATGHCAHCHEQHASIGGAEPAPNTGADAGPDNYLVFGEWSDNYYNDFCNKCHDGSLTGVDNIAQLYSKTYIHPTTGHHFRTETGSDLGTYRHGYCIDCHEPHIAQDTTHNPAVDGNTASGAIKGTWGVEPSFSSPGDPPAGTETLSTPSYTKVNPITKEYQLCLKCHSSYAYGSSPPTGYTDQGKEFNPYNYCFHPVTGTGQQWKNKNIRANYTTLLKAPWNANLDARMYCSDCHGSDTSTDPKGPHGSNKKYLLKAWGAINNANSAYCYDNLCLLCHVDGYADGNGVSTPWTHKSNTAHRYEGETLDQNRLGCAACHGGPAGYADFSGNPDAVQNGSNGGRTGAIHGENFYWDNGNLYNGTTKTTFNNPALHFLLGGYNIGMNFNEYGGTTDGKSVDDSGYCWSYGTGASGAPCGAMSGGKSWP